MAKTYRDPILLLGSYGRGNIGDDAFLVAAQELLKGRKIFINSSNDDLLPRVSGVAVETLSTSGFRDIGVKLRTFRGIKHVVYGGGDLWVELYGDRFPRASLYKMVMLNVFARMAGKKIHYLGCGAGDLRGYSLFLARLSARLAHNVVLRDEHSAALLRVRHATVLPDLATTLSYPPPSLHRRKRFKIGLSLLYYLPDSAKTFPRVLKQITEFLDSLSPDYYEITLFPLLVSKDTPHDDQWVAEQLRASLKRHKVSVCLERRLDRFNAKLAQMDLLIGARLHANILASMCGVPCVGLAYRPKVARFFETTGLTRYCIGLDDLAQLPDRVMGIEHNYSLVRSQFAAVRQKCLQKGATYRQYVKAHF